MKRIIFASIIALLATAAHADYSLPAGNCINVCAVLGSTGGGPGPTPPPTPTPNPTPNPGACGPSTKYLSFNWNNASRQTFAMAADDVVVVSFTTGVLDSASNNLPRLAAAEWGSPPSGRTSTLSDKPCDFSPQPSLAATSAGNSIQVPFAVGDGNNFGYYPRLARNTTYYWNIKNVPGQSCSAQGICDMFVELLKPAGL